MIGSASGIGSRNGIVIISSTFIGRIESYVCYLINFFISLEERSAKSSILRLSRFMLAILGGSCGSRFFAMLVFPGKQALFPALCIHVQTIGLYYFVIAKAHFCR